MALVEYRVQDGVAILELNNPPANAYTLESLKQLDEAIVKARFDSSLKCSCCEARARSFSAPAPTSTCCPASRTSFEITSRFTVTKR